MMGRLRCALLPGFTIPDDVTIVATWTDREQGTHWIVLEGDALPAWVPQMDALIVPTSEVNLGLNEARKAVWKAREDVWHRRT